MAKNIFTRGRYSTAISKEFKKRGKRGLSLVEVGLGLAVIAVSLSSLSQMLAENARTVRVKATSEKLIEVSAAAKRYAIAHQTDLKALATTGNPIVIPVGKSCPTCGVPSGPNGLPSLQSGGYLSDTFVNKNSMNAEHAMLVREDSDGDLEILISTYGGVQMNDADLGRVSGMLGSGGGGVFANSPNAPSTQIVGAFGGWTTPRARWQAGNASPQIGTPVVSLSTANVGYDDYLNRTDTGNPEDNTMRTDLHLGGVDSNGDGVYDSGYAYDINGAGLVASNYANIGIDAEIGNNLTVGNDASIANDATIGNDLFVNQYATIGDDLYVGNDAFAGNNVNATNNVNAGNDVTAQNDVVANRWGYSTFGDSTQGQTVLTQNGLDNIAASGGNIHIRPSNSGTVNIDTTQNNGNGVFNSAMNTNSFDNNSRMCDDRTYGCYTSFGDDGYFQELTPTQRSWLTLKTPIGLNISNPTGVTNGANLNVNGHSRTKGRIWGHDDVILDMTRNSKDRTALYAIDRNGNNQELIGLHQRPNYDANGVYIAGTNAYNSNVRNTRRIYFGGTGTQASNETAYVDLERGVNVAGYHSARAFVDRDDPNTRFLLDLNESSFLNNLEVAQIRIAGMPQGHTIKDYLSNWVMKSSFHITQPASTAAGAGNFAIVPKPRCAAGGRQKIVVIPQAWGDEVKLWNRQRQFGRWRYTNNTNQYETLYFNYTAEDRGTFWRVKLDSTSNTHTGRRSPLTIPERALAHTYCHYDDFRHQIPDANNPNNTF